MQSQNAIFVGVSTVLVPYSLLLYSGMSLRSVYTEISFFALGVGLKNLFQSFCSFSGLIPGPGYWVVYCMNYRLVPVQAIRWCILSIIDTFESRLMVFSPPPSILGENFLDPLYLGVINFYFQNLGGKSPLGGTGNYLGGTTPSKVYISDTTKF